MTGIRQELPTEKHVSGSTPPRGAKRMFVFGVILKELGHAPLFSAVGFCSFTDARNCSVALLALLRRRSGAPLRDLVAGTQPVVRESNASFRVVVPMVVKAKDPIFGWVNSHFRTYFSGDWDVHWGYGILTHGHFQDVLLKLRGI